MTAIQDSSLPSKRKPFCFRSVSVRLSSMHLIGWGEDSSGDFFGGDLAMALNRQVFMTRDPCFPCDPLEDVHCFSPDVIHGVVVPDDAPSGDVLSSDCYSHSFDFNPGELFFFPENSPGIVCVQQHFYLTDEEIHPVQSLSVLPSVDLCFYFCSSMSSLEANAFLEPYYGFSTLVRKLLLGQFLCQGYSDIWVYHLFPAFYSLFPDPLGTVEVSLFL